MKNILVLLAISVLAAPFAWSVEADQSPADLDRQEREAIEREVNEFVKQQDIEAGVNPDENEKQRAARHKKACKGIIAKFDVNNDGQLDPEERAALRQHIRSKHKDRVRNADRDGDGVLNRNEKRQGQNSEGNLERRQDRAERNLEKRANAKGERSAERNTRQNNGNSGKQSTDGKTSKSQGKTKSNKSKSKKR